MKIENYKGVDIHHNAHKDEFYTYVVIRKGISSKKDEVIAAPRLQRIRDEIDKFLNTAAKKPVLKKVWRRGRYDSDKNYELVEVVLRNSISNTTEVRGKDGKTCVISSDRYNDDKLFVQCKENDAIIKNLNEKQKQIEKIEKEISCSGGKLITLKEEHFK